MSRMEYVNSKKKAGFGIEISIYIYVGVFPNCFIIFFF